MQKVFLSICFMLSIFFVDAQVTHSMSYGVGVNVSWYRSDLKQQNSYMSFLMPTTMVDYTKHSENAIWGGIGAGFNFRRIPFFKVKHEFNSGLQAPEFCARIRAGFSIIRERTIHMPFISLGISTFPEVDAYTEGTNGSIYYTSSNDTMYKMRKANPFVELGFKTLKSTFREDNKNGFLSFTLRYYPLSIFSEPQKYLYSYPIYHMAQYHIIELSMVTGLQFNVHK